MKPRATPGRVDQPRTDAGEAALDAGQQRQHGGPDARAPGRIERGVERPAAGAVDTDQRPRHLGVVAVQLQRELDAHAPADQDRRLDLGVVDQRQQIADLVVHAQRPREAGAPLS